MRMKPRSGKSLFLYLALLIVAIVAMVILYRHSHSNGRPGQPIPTPGDTLRIAIVYSPMSYYIYDDTIGGLNYDMLRQMSADMHRPVRFIPVVSLQQSLEALTRGQCDMLVSLPLTASMRDKFLFSESIFLDRQVLIQRPGSGSVKSVLDIAGDTIHIKKYSPARERLDNLSAEIGDEITICSHDDLSDEYLFLKVADGSLRYAVINEKTARILQQKHPEVALTPIGFTQFQSWLTRRTDVALHDSIDSWLLRFKSTPAYQNLLSRYSAASDSIPKN